MSSRLTAFAGSPQPQPLNVMNMPDPHRRDGVAAATAVELEAGGEIPTASSIASFISQGAMV